MTFVLSSKGGNFDLRRGSTLGKKTRTGATTNERCIKHYRRSIRTLPPLLKSYLRPVRRVPHDGVATFMKNGRKYNRCSISAKKKKCWTFGVSTKPGLKIVIRIDFEFELKILTVGELQRYTESLCDKGRFKYFNAALNIIFSHFVSDSRSRE